jgi:hypothetical protein
LFVHIETAFHNKTSSVSTPTQQNHPLHTSSVKVSAAQVQPPVIAPSPVASNPNSTSNQIALALYDYEPQNEGEISIRENDQLFVLDSSDSDWWLVKYMDRVGEGLVPASYVEVSISNVA